MKYTGMLANVQFSTKCEPFRTISRNYVGLVGKSTSPRTVLGIKLCAQLLVSDSFDSKVRSNAIQA